MDKYTTFERLAANKWWVHCNGEPLTTYQVTHLLNELTEENAQLKELINMICEADSYTKRGSVKEILRDTIKSIDTAAEYNWIFGDSFGRICQHTLMPGIFHADQRQGTEGKEKDKIKCKPVNRNNRHVHNLSCTPDWKIEERNQPDRSFCSGLQQFTFFDFSDNYKDKRVNP